MTKFNSSLSISSHPNYFNWNGSVQNWLLKLIIEHPTEATSIHDKSTHFVQHSTWFLLELVSGASKTRIRTLYLQSKIRNSNIVITMFEFYKLRNVYTVITMFDFLILLCNYNVKIWSWRIIWQMLKCRMLNRRSSCCWPQHSTYYRLPKPGGQ